MDLTNITTWFPTTEIPDVTTMEMPDVKYPIYVGYICVLIAVVLFGSNFVPVKKFETGDGLFFQLISCSVIWCAGLAVNAYRGFPKFFPLPMIGGFLWCTGNIMTIPIIKTVGLGQGLCIWASFNLLSGWASARFGWFGMTPEYPEHLALNYVGVTFCTISAIVYMFLKTDVRPVTEEVSVNESTVTQPRDDGNESDDQCILSDEVSKRGLMNDSVGSLITITPVEQGSIFDRLPRVTKRILGTVMAVIAGLLFGLNFVPVIYIEDTYPGQKHSKSMDYVFSHFSGILVTSIFYFAVYCAIKRNKPLLYPQAILPSMVSGLMWAIADIAWFVANDALSPAICFPIITSVPAIIAAGWGIVFKEISGLRNFLVLGFAIVFAVTGSTLTGLSKGNSGSNSTHLDHSYFP